MKFKKNKLKDLPDEAGIYKFSNDGGKIIYIGKAINLRKRVSSYLYAKSSHIRRTKKLISEINNVEVIVVNSEFEALLLEAKLIRKYQPKYNIRWKDDKHYIYIAITKDDYPLVKLGRNQKNFKQIFGPFSSARIARDLLKLIREVIPFCSQNPLIKKPCFYTHIGLCFPCPGRIRKESKEKKVILRRKYLANIRQIINLLKGDSKKVQKFLEKRMQHYSKLKKYEQAAIYRDRLRRFSYLVTDYRFVDLYIRDSMYIKKKRKKEAEELKILLNQYYPNLSSIKQIECFDISNLFGKQATGSMVTFIEGKPVKSKYRRFKIRKVKKSDDFAALREVLTRRLKHKEWELPDIVVVDGGRPQIIAFQKVLKEMNITIPIVGIAKKYEEIVVPVEERSFKKIQLSKYSEALHLIIRLRNEAHRFAHKYHQHLRLKALLENY